VVKASVDTPGAIVERMADVFVKAMEKYERDKKKRAAAMAGLRAKYAKEEK
jgi:hypothetical protein